MGYAKSSASWINFSEPSAVVLAVSREGCGGPAGVLFALCDKIRNTDDTNEYDLL